MAAGLQCFDAAGRLLFSSGDRLARVLGIRNVGRYDPATGSFTDANLLLGEGFAFFFRTSEYGWPFAYVLTVSGQTVSWRTTLFKDSSGNMGHPEGYIIYGIR